MAVHFASLKEPGGVGYHGGAVLYATLGYLTGWLGLLQASWLVNAAATLLLAHSMVIAAYLVHECAHNTIFVRSRDNARLGTYLGWLCGASYGTYDDIRYKHFRHHIDNDDVVWFDYERFFERHSVLTRLIRTAEYVYIPAHEVLMHAIMMLTSFVIPERRHQRRHNLLVLAIRGGLFVWLVVVVPKAACLYLLAYLMMLHVLRFMDMLQHDYPYSLTLFAGSDAAHKGDRVWEQEHTFSNPLSLRYERLNWLVLNFGFHNAHHSAMDQPWYRLPALHRKLCGDNPSRVIPLGSQLKLYHNNRLNRVHNPRATSYPQGEQYLQLARAGEGPIGGNAASFLTSF